MSYSSNDQQAYDRAITMFSPDGRLYQVDYAREAVKRGTTALGIKAKDGIVLMVDKRARSKLIEASSIEKIFKVDEHIAIASAGLSGDARALVERARVECQINRVNFGEGIEPVALAKALADHIQHLTQYGGIRPYGASLLIAGVSEGVFKLFEADPSGTLLEYKATCIGIGRTDVVSLLEKEYNTDITVEEAIELGVKALGEATRGEITTADIQVSIISKENLIIKEV